jgi:hypothetical protein
MWSVTVPAHSLPFRLIVYNTIRVLGKLHWARNMYNFSLQLSFQILFGLNKHKAANTSVIFVPP